jgi:hypothetical protein
LHPVIGGPNVYPDSNQAFVTVYFKDGSVYVSSGGHGDENVVFGTSSITTQSMSGSKITMEDYYTGIVDTTSKLTFNVTVPSLASRECEPILGLRPISKTDLCPIPET